MKNQFRLFSYWIKFYKTSVGSFILNDELLNLSIKIRESIQQHRRLYILSGGVFHYTVIRINQDIPRSGSNTQINLPWSVRLAAICIYSHQLRPDTP